MGIKIVVIGFSTLTKEVDIHRKANMSMQIKMGRIATIKQLTLLLPGTTRRKI